MEQAIASTKDPDRKALLLTRYATGIKNSFGYCWALSSYGVSQRYRDPEELPDVFYVAQERGFSKAETLYKRALSLCNDKETAAQVNYFLGNLKTVVKQYGTTKTAEYIRGRCDTYADYHLERKKQFLL